MRKKFGVLVFLSAMMPSVSCGVDNTSITLDPGLGSLENIIYTCSYNSKYELPVPKTPTRDFSGGLICYYSFDGWYLNDNLIPQSGTRWTYARKDCTLVAKYKLDHIEYGLYPQTHVLDEEMVSFLDTLTQTESNGWYFYDGDYYEKMTTKEYVSGYRFNDGTRITRTTEYWFKCEPIKWKILLSDENEYKLVSSVILDVHCYHSSWENRTIDGKTVFCTDYKYSDIRTWLNDDFYNSAFASGNSYIQTTEVDNSASTTCSSTSKYAYENSFDKVYLLSYQDYMNKSYFVDDETRCCMTTDYARANDCSASNKNSGEYWTRSPNLDSSECASSVGVWGYLNNYDNVFDYSVGVRPAITIKL